MSFVLKKENGDIILYDYKHYSVYLANQKKIIESSPSWHQVRTQVRMELCPLVTRTENVFRSIGDSAHLIYRTFRDTSIEGKEYYVVNLIRKEELMAGGSIADSSSIRSSRFVFDARTKLPHSFQESVSWRKDSQYTVIRFDSISSVNSISSDKLLSHIHSLRDSLKSLKDIVIEEKSNKPPKAKELLKNDTYAYNVRFITPESDTMHLANVDSKLTLLEFWYITCFPCQLQIPLLNRIDQKYKNKGLMIIALDPFDDVRSERMHEHITKNQIGYQVASVSKLIAEQKFNVDAYPALYLLDKDKKVIFSNVGYGENLEQTLEDIIEQNLR
ncbi:MAG: TlpA disulfide reductase family protein [Bacteroidota bacterium]|nr:TlpA disulfide reductase family protein [Bacteroidota bacterium]MDP4237618.1 TlpA disulfide reductase family protein [Bacteroidota bacterium]